MNGLWGGAQVRGGEEEDVTRLPHCSASTLLPHPGWVPLTALGQATHYGPSFNTQRKYVARLEQLRDTLEQSPFFRTHEVRAPATVPSAGPRSGGGRGVWHGEDAVGDSGRSRGKEAPTCATPSRVSQWREGSGAGLRTTLGI